VIKVAGTIQQNLALQLISTWF